MDQYPVIAKAKVFALEIAEFLKNLVREFFEKGCQKSAAALTYMTLFALVPMMTVTYSMFSVIPAFNGVAEQLQGLIFDNFVPETGEEVSRYLSDFSSQARNLTGVGIGMLVVTAYLMLTNIEKTFNDIWGVKQARKGLSSFLLYWAVLSIGPILLGTGLVISGYLLSLKMTVAEYDALGLAPRLFQMLPLLMTTIAFTLLFAAVPNCRVPIKYAITGGLVTAILFELLKIAFSSLVANSSFKLIYGAFAVVPLFLLWVNLLWMVVLSGAVFVRTLSERGYGSRKLPLSDIRAALQCLALFRERAQTGDRVSDMDIVKVGVNLVHWQSLRSLLVKDKWIAVTSSGNYTLCRDLKSVTVWDVAALVNMPIDETIPEKEQIKYHAATESWLDDYFSRRERVEEYARNAFDINLEELFTLEKQMATN